MQFEDVKELISIFEKTDLNEMEVHLDNASVRLDRGQKVSSVQVSGASKANTFNTVVEDIKTASNVAVVEESKSVSAVDENARYIKSPIVGTFYQSSTPNGEPFVKCGSYVEQGDIVCIIEAMKFMNEVASEESGIIEEILVKDGDFVEFGQPLFRIK